MSEQPEQEYQPATELTEKDLLAAIGNEYMQLDAALGLVEQKRQNIALLKAELQKLQSAPK